MSMQLPAPAALEKLIRIEVQVMQPISLGELSGTERRIIPITGGKLSGPGFSGTILPGGSDIQLVRTDGMIELTARYAADLGPAGKLLIENTGIRRAAPGESSEPPYFRGVVRFCTPPGELQWLDQSVFVSSGWREGGTVFLDVYALR